MLSINNAAPTIGTGGPRVGSNLKPFFLNTVNSGAPPLLPLSLPRDDSTAGEPQARYAQRMLVLEWR